MPALLDPIPTEASPSAFADAVARVETGRERIILTRAGKAVVALVPIADLDAIEEAEDVAAAASGLAEYERSGKDWPTYTVDELAARWGISVRDLAPDERGCAACDRRQRSGGQPTGHHRKFGSPIAIQTWRHQRMQC